MPYPIDMEMESIIRVQPERIIDPKAEGKDLHSQRFMLQLAAIFNDLKGIGYLGHISSKFPVPTENTASFGNFTGAKHQLCRYACDSIHQALDFLSEQDSQDALSHPRVQKAIASLPAENHRSWHDIIETANTIPRDNRQKAGAAEGFRAGLKRNLSMI